MNETESGIKISTADFRLLQPYSDYLTKAVSPLWGEVSSSKPGDSLFELGRIALSNKALVEDIHVSHLRDTIIENEVNPYLVKLVSNFDKYSELIDKIQRKKTDLTWDDERLHEDGLPENLFEEHRAYQKELYHPTPVCLRDLHIESLDILCEYEVNPKLRKFINKIGGIALFEELIALATKQDSVDLDRVVPFTDLAYQGLNKWSVLLEPVSPPLFCLLSKDNRLLLKEQNPKLLEILERFFLLEFGPHNSSVYVVPSVENPTGSLSREYELDLLYLEQHKMKEEEYINLLGELCMSFHKVKEGTRSYTFKGVEFRKLSISHYDERSPFTGEIPEQEDFDLVLYKGGKEVGVIPSCWKYFASEGIYESPGARFSFSPRKILPLFAK
ncbi:hypothetical protein JW796_02710 [Candidatus Dojkabacteria bacterium]|nr:hypothetical protein [Candidatus Dojkabacteria bacterium]